MATFALTDAVIHADEVDLSGYANQITHEVQVDELDDSTFGDTYRSRIGGPRMGTFQASGFAEFATPDSELFGDVAADVLHTVAPATTDGGRAYIFTVVETGYQVGASYGDVLGFQVTGATDGVVVPAKYLFPKADVSGNTTGTGQQYSAAVASGESLYVATHIFSAGTTVDVIVESDDNSGFSSATERDNNTRTTTGSWLTTVAGPIATDTYYRVRFANVTGTFSVAVAVGIA